MGVPLRVLIVDDSENDCILLVHELKKGGFDLYYRRVETSGGLTDCMDQESWDLVLSDFHMPQFGGLEALALFLKRKIDIPFILVSGTVGEETAVEAMKAGAHDYIMKTKLSRLVPAIRRELREAQTRKEARETAEKLNRAQKLETIGQLASGIAHDFNSILTVIMLYAEGILRREEEGNRSRKEAQEIQKAADRGAALTRQLLVLSRKQEWNPKIVDINKMILNLVNMLQRLIGKNIDLITRFDSAMGLIQIDPGQFEQIVLNLVVNARDAIGDKSGKIILSTRVQDPSVIFEVEDTGQGMDEVTKMRIFEPFFSTKGPEKGTGLGLATVHEIVGRSKGTLEVKSELGKGTIFTLSFPLSEPLKAVPEPTLVIPQRVMSRSILLVEDEEAVRTPLSQGLKSQGFEIIEAKNGNDALFLAEQYPREIEVLVTDVLMPGMNGIELSKRLRAARPDIKVIFTSGYGKESLPFHLTDPKESVFFLLKPFTVATLIEKIAALSS